MRTQARGMQPAGLLKRMPAPSTTMNEHRISLDGAARQLRRAQRGWRIVPPGQTASRLERSPRRGGSRGNGAHTHEVVGSPPSLGCWLATLNAAGNRPRSEDVVRPPSHATLIATPMLRRGPLRPPRAARQALLHAAWLVLFRAWRKGPCP